MENYKLYESNADNKRMLGGANDLPTKSRRRERTRNLPGNRESKMFNCLDNTPFNPEGILVFRRISLPILFLFAIFSFHGDAQRQVGIMKAIFLTRVRDEVNLYQC